MANIVEMTSKRIKFHFVSTQAKNDVWLEKKSTRIAPLHTHTTKPKPKAQTKPKSSSTVVPKESQVVSGKSESNAMHSKQAETKDKLDGAEIPLDGNGKQKTKVKIEGEDESDGLSFADFDDEDSDDEIDSDRGSENNEKGATSSNNKETMEESPTVTDHSSSDGSHKRDFESSQAENSDFENECRSSKGFTIPKKNNGSNKKTSVVVPKNAIPKKVQSSVTSGTSLISDAARQAMIEKNTANKMPNPSKKSSPRKDARQVDRNKIHKDDHNSPSLKRKAFSDLSPSQRQHARGSQSQRPNESPSKKESNRQNLSPKRSLSDKHFVEQRREKEFYRDSMEYTAQGQSSSYRDSSGSRDFPIRNQPSNRSLNDRHLYEDRRERELYRDSIEYSARESYGYRSFPSSDHRRISGHSSSRAYDSYSHQDQYESDRGQSRHYDRSHQQDSHARYLERSSGYYDVQYDQSSNERHRSDGRVSSDRSSYQYDSQRFDDYSRRHEDESSSRAPRPENDYSREPRGMSERNIERDSHFYRMQSDYEHAHSYHRDDDHHSPRRHRDSGGRREKKRKKKFDGSDEYSRRLESYSYNQGRNYSNEDRYSR